MIVEYTSVMRHPDRDNWYCIVGKNAENGSEVHSWFAGEAIQWRMAEYGLADDQADLAFKMVFSEGMECVDPRLQDSAPAITHPFRLAASEALVNKSSRLTAVSAAQNARLSSLPVTPRNDRVDLYQAFLPMMGPVTGRSLEHKRLIAHAYRNTTDYMSELIHKQAIRRFEMGDASTVADALRVGEQEAQRKIATK